jgi:hypothetical protein
VGIACSRGLGWMNNLEWKLLESGFDKVGYERNM